MSDHWLRDIPFFREQIAKANKTTPYGDGLPAPWAFLDAMCDCAETMAIRVTALESELKALKDAPVPAKVPDDEMIGAGVATLQRFRNGGKAEDLVRDIYTAMLAAAQEGKPQAQQQPTHDPDADYYRSAP
jgi:hypothetical protein